VRNFWVDPRSGRVVSFDLDEKKSLTSTRIANIPLSSLRQIGDVVLVNDDEAASQQPYDDRYGFVALIGMGVRTRSGNLLGKVR
jgi:sporulation protein YlmC with PRC-barrel domain